MPEDSAELQAEGGKRVTITIAEMAENEINGTDAIGPGDEPNTFVISNGKYRLTITIAE
ncbi:MAG TPA: hypothetical protein VNA22_03155 [Pyrinomonadaceae bacterium]|nr:hypothetical protein [Pyrinomonadaceae bacterium]